MSRPRGGRGKSSPRGRGAAPLARTARGRNRGSSSGARWRAGRAGGLRVQAEPRKAWTRSFGRAGWKPALAWTRGLSIATMAGPWSPASRHARRKSDERSEELFGELLERSERTYTLSEAKRASPEGGRERSEANRRARGNNFPLLEIRLTNAGRAGHLVRCDLGHTVSGALQGEPLWAVLTASQTPPRTVTPGRPGQAGYGPHGDAGAWFAIAPWLVRELGNPYAYGTAMTRGQRTPGSRGCPPTPIYGRTRVRSNYSAVIHAGRIVATL